MTFAQKIGAGVVMLLLGIASLITLIPTFARANPSFFIRSGNGATSTPLGYLSPLNGTTTISYDLGVGGAQAADNAILALQLLGSSTPTNAAIATSTFNVLIEYSQDNIDWYSTGQFATTTNLGWETTKGVLIGSTTPTKIFVTPVTPTRYIRAVVTIPSGSNNGAVWGEFIAKRQSN